MSGNRAAGRINVSWFDWRDGVAIDETIPRGAGLTNVSLFRFARPVTRYCDALTTGVRPRASHGPIHPHGSIPNPDSIPNRGSIPNRRR